MRFLIKSLIVLFVFLPAYALAGSFKAVPVRLFLDAGKKTAVLKITNEGDEKVTIQLEAMRWSQDEKGEDRYEETKDIIFFPKIVDIEKGKEKIIRVGYQGGDLGAIEKTYRLFLQELPVKKPGEMALRLALRLGIPIFIRPIKEVQEREIEGIELKDGKVLMRIKNTGNTHFIIRKINVTGIDGSEKEVFTKDIRGWYLLSKITRDYTIEIPYEACLKTSRIKVEVETEGTGLKAETKVDASLCGN